MISCFMDAFNVFSFLNFFFFFLLFFFLGKVIWGDVYMGFSSERRTNTKTIEGVKEFK